MMKPVLIGLGLFTLTLTLYGKQRYINDVLPGEAVPFTEDELPATPQSLRELAPVEGQARATLIADLRARAAGVYPYQATLEVSLPELAADEEWEGGEEQFLVRAFSESEWFLVHHGDDRTFVDRSGSALSFGTGWDLGKWLTRGPDHEVSGGGALTLPTWMLSEEYLQGIDEETGEARFGLTLESRPKALVEVDVDTRTGLIAGLTMMVAESVDGYGVQMMNVALEVVDVEFGIEFDVENAGPRPSDAAATFGEAPALRVGVVPGA